MQKLSVLVIILACMATGCDSGVNSQEGSSAVADSPAKAEIERGGSITVGEQTWTIVISTQCSIYPGDIINVAGHAAEDPSLEIVIDYGGPNGAYISNESSSTGWRALTDTLKIEIEGRNVHGSATFKSIGSGTSSSSEGSLDINC